ncbi:hypothetical protein DY000_02007338 [Brassica cretica]|uniref:Uncharacterized protein n=1 Tax=Brassica cretica TaxID=69181 RepID=A0ABQ7C1W1_BRACR|nr:hypothetical protein DY000_02007338 [Brassica cretica]
MRIGCSFRLGILCDKKKGGMLLALKLSSIFEDLQRMVVENFCFEKTDADLELSYLPIGLISTSAKDGNQNKVDIDLYKVPTESTTGEEEHNFSNNGDDSRADNVSSDMHNEKKKGKMKQVGVDGDDYDADTIISEKENRENLGISIDTPFAPSIDYSIGISIDAFLVKLYARVELCSLGFIDQLLPYSSNRSSSRTDSGGQTLINKPIGVRFLGISIDAFLVKLYARVELCSLGFIDQLLPYSSNRSSSRTDSGYDASDDLSLQLLGQVLAS